MAKKLFDNYDNLLNAEGLQDEYEEFYGGGISQNIIQDGKEVIVYYYLDNHYQPIGLDDFLKMRASDYAQSLYNETEKHLEEIKKEELESFLIKFSFYYWNIFNEFEKINNVAGSPIEVFFEKFNNISNKIDKIFAVFF